MEALDVMAQSETLGDLVRATVVALDDNDVPTVQWGNPLQTAACDRLAASDGPPARLAKGDWVLIAVSGAGARRPLILGRIGPSAAARPPETPDHLIIQASQALTLKCGQGSVDIRADGKILIKGKDVVSHAQATNRIKGGSVSIN